MAVSRIWGAFFAGIAGLRPGPGPGSGPGLEVCKRLVLGLGG